MNTSYFFIFHIVITTHIASLTYFDRIIPLWKFFFRFIRKEIRIDIFHSSGAGGQGVNTSFSAVRVTHLPTGISVSCQNERSQIQNKETALSILKSRLYQLELDKRREEKLKNENKMDISFGSQIRTYTFHPYSLVKDHRTNYETQRVDKVMDGELDDFIKEYLKMEATK